jgi:transposase
MIARSLPGHDRPLFTTHDRAVFTTPSPPGDYHRGIILPAKTWRGTIMERIHLNYYTDIIYRLRSGESERQIAKDLGLSRPTVHKYHLKAQAEGLLDNPEKPGSATLCASLGPAPCPPKTPSSVEPYRGIVQGYVDQGLEMTAIFQRLKEDHQYGGSYSSVRRFVPQLKPKEVEAFIRVHCEPGEELQVDFGHVGDLFDPQTGKVRPAYAFVATLSHSRHQYAELVFDQRTATWIGLHQRAFAFFGGVPKRVVLDNLKAAVIQALVIDPVLGEAYRKLAQHYGFLVSPNRPRTPRHKGKVENGVHYLQRNFMAGQQFADLPSANRRLLTWVMETAGVRQHGTTHQAPLTLFRQVEQAALQALPEEPFTLCDIRTAKVHPDCHIVVDKSYYSVSYRLVGQTVEVHLHEKVVEIYAGQSLVRTHIRAQTPGQWRTQLADYPPYKAEYLTHTPAYCRQRASQIGPATYQVVDELLSDKVLERLRSVQAILRLESSVGAGRLEAACQRALYFGDGRYRRIKDILNAALDQEPLPEMVPSGTSAPTFTFARKAGEFFNHSVEKSA